MPLLDRINQILKYKMYTCCGKPARLSYHMLFDIEKELFSLQRSEGNSVVASMDRHPGQSINGINIAFGLLEADTLVADVACRFGCNERTIYCLLARF